MLRCVSREGGLLRGMCCGCGVSRVSDVIRRRVSVLSMSMSMYVCRLYVIYPGRSAVSDPCETRPCQAPVARTLYGCTARWVGTRDAARRGQLWVLRARGINMLMLMLIDGVLYTTTDEHADEM